MAFKKVEEILKQDQYSPLSMENQVMVMYALINGFLDDVEVDKIIEWEKSFHKFMQSSKREVLESIASEKKLTDDIVEKLEKAIKEFKETF